MVAGVHEPVPQLTRAREFPLFLVKVAVVNLHLRLKTTNEIGRVLSGAAGALGKAPLIGQISSSAVPLLFQGRMLFFQGLNQRKLTGNLGTMLAQMLREDGVITLPLQSSLILSQRLLSDLFHAECAAQCPVTTSSTGVINDLLGVLELVAGLVDPPTNLVHIRCS